MNTRRKMVMALGAGHPDESYECGPSTMLKSIETAAQKFRVKMLAMEARSLQEINNAFAIMVWERAEGIIVMLDPVFVAERRPIAELAAKHRLPSVASFREYVEDGGLISYGQNLAEHFRRMTTYVDKILKGAKPAGLPVEQPTKFELIINRKTASALGLTIPQSLLISADKVIE